MGMSLVRSRINGLIRDPLVWISILVFLVALSPYFLHYLNAEKLADYADTWADLAFIAVIILLIVYRRPAAASRREQGFWMAWAAGFAFWFVGRLAWGLLYSVGLPIDLVADFLYLLLYVSILVALQLDPDGPPPSKFGQVLNRYTLGGGIVLFLAGYAYFAFIPAIFSPVTYESWKPAVIGTVIFDTYVLVRLFIRFRAAVTPYWRRVYGWMVAAFAIWVLTDAADVVWLFIPLPELEPGSILDLIWYTPYVLFMVSLLVGRREHCASRVAAEDVDLVVMADPLGATPLVGYALALPLIHTLLELTGLYDPTLRSAREILLVGETLILAFLLFRTHRLVLGENRRLRQGYEDISRALEKANRGLEDRVARRTSELEEANLLLAADLQERARVEKRLRATEERNLALIRAVPDSLILVGCDGVVLEVFPSSTVEDRLDLSGSQGRFLCEVLPQNHRDKIEAAVELIRTGAKQETVSIQAETSEGMWHLDFRFGRCGADEILVLIQDVTERRNFETSLHQSQKLESLGVMAGGIAHDFNNLLASILGNAQLAKEMQAEETSSSQPLDAIESSALRAAKLTSNLLAYAGEAHIDLEPLNLANIFADMHNLLSSAVPKRIKFDFEIAQDPLWIDGNEAQVTQILMNLVRNAAESLVGRTGSVRVDLQSCRISEAGLPGQVLCEHPASGPYVRLRVSDSGCGMDPKVQQRIFDPFYTSKGTGRGLGLAAVLGIVSHHKGTLTLESQPQGGTVFTVYFPARIEPAAQEPQPAVTGLAQGAGTILVVDDEEGVRRLICSYLSRLGFTMVEADNGAMAVAQAQTHRGQLAAIFMDYSMPEMSGAEAFHVIREDDGDIPVIMMSGYGERETLDALADEHRTAFLAKPFELSEITRVLGGPFGLLEQGEQG